MQQTIRYATAELPGTTYVKHTVTLDDDARTIRVADPRSLATVVELQYVTADGPHGSGRGRTWKLRNAEGDEIGRVSDLGCGCRERVQVKRTAAT